MEIIMQSKINAEEEALSDIAAKNYMLVCVGGGISPHLFPNDCDSISTDLLYWLQSSLPMKYFFGESGCTAHGRATMPEVAYAKDYNTTMLCYLAEHAAEHFDLSVEPKRICRFDEKRAMPDSQKHLS